MLGGILPFLIQWLALSQFGSQLLYQQSSPLSSYNQDTSYPQYSSFPPKSQWTLLSEFATLPEDEIEKFLPQVCNILLDRDMVSDERIVDQYERILLDKCAQCLPFGLKVCSLLKAASQIPSEGLFRNLFPPGGNSNNQDKQDRLRKVQEKLEIATSYGMNLSPEVSQARCEYYRDMIFMVDSLARLGTELKSYPVSERNHHLRVAISQLNSLLYRRMMNKGRCNFDSNYPGHESHYQSHDHMSFSTELFYNYHSPSSPSQLSESYPIVDQTSNLPQRHLDNYPNTLTNDYPLNQYSQPQPQLPQQHRLSMYSTNRSAGF